MVASGCFGAFFAPPELDESTINNRESAIFSTSVFNPGRAAIRAGVTAYKNEVDGAIVALQSLGRSSSLEDRLQVDASLQGDVRALAARHLRQGVLETFEDDAKFGRTPTDQDVEDRLFRFASYLDAKAATTRAKEGAARARQPHANTDKSTPKDTGRAAEDTKPGPSKDQRPATPKRANFMGRRVLASGVSETVYTRVLHLGNCFKCGAKGGRSSVCPSPRACALCAGVEAPKSHKTNDCPRLSDKKSA